MILYVYDLVGLIQTFDGKSVYQWIDFTGIIYVNSAVNHCFKRCFFFYGKCTGQW